MGTRSQQRVVETLSKRPSVQLLKERKRIVLRHSLMSPVALWDTRCVAAGGRLIRHEMMSERRHTALHRIDRRSVWESAQNASRPAD